MVVSKLFHVLFGKECHPIITGFHKSSIIVFANGKLQVIFGIQPNFETGELSYSQNVSLNLKPELPQNFECKKLVTSSSKHHVALVGNNEVFLISLPYDLSCFAFKLERIKDTYFCESLPLIKGKYGKKIKINEVKWSDDDEVFNSSTVGVLLSNNSVELYSVLDVKKPIAIANFGLLLPNDSNTFGLSTMLENFSFGPKFKSEITDDQYYTIFAVDNEGQFYTISFIVDKGKVLKIFSPTKGIYIFGNDNRHSINNICDILLLNNSCRDKIPIFSVVTYSGTVMHLTSLIKSDVDWKNGIPDFELYVVENYQLPTVKVEAGNSITISNDSTTPNNYMIQDLYSLYSVDYTTSLNGLISQMINKPFSDQTEPLKFHQIFGCSGSIIPNTGSVVCLDDSELKKMPLQSVLFLCVCSDGNILYHCIYRELMRKLKIPENVENKITEIAPKPTESNLISEILTIMSKRQVFPAFKISEKPSEKVQLECMIDALKIILANNEILHQGIEKVDTTIEKMSTLHKENCTFVDKELDRLSEYFDDLMRLKETIKICRDSIKGLIKRTDKIMDYVIPSDDVPLIENEIKIYGKLEEIENLCESMSKATFNILEDVNNKKSILYGTTKSFQSSASGQKFMLMKNTKDIEDLQKWTKKLQSSVDEFF
ncbi:Nucleoporin Nup88 family-containing protein [Strongyloides ratti]|uniref:Nucleoporin Nup88 family-containing protein n=1 Tax=Strongyloides ratti TaxID=34506 RepID=A0A090MWY8_STRRB|nr:Nucleoporin Nup88 family-containing protein [Strongyloides ratti]CEF64509.1 Nucleoporin Nup88 family-containing protein [Strongyloides ratti]